MAEESTSADPAQRSRTTAPAVENARFAIGGGNELRPFESKDAPELFALIERNRRELSRWLAWAQEPSAEQTIAYIARRRAAEAEHRSVGGVMVVEGRIVGAAGLEGIDRANSCAAIGYWLDREHQGRGLMTAAAAVLVRHGFDGLQLNRIEIRTDVTNRPSRAVAERLGFRHEGSLRQAYRIAGERYSDDAVYAMLASDPERQLLPRLDGSADAGPLGRAVT